MAEQIYLNHAATSLKKPPAVIAALVSYLQQNEEIALQRSFLGQGTAQNAFEARTAVAEFFAATDASHVIFTPNVTTSLNMILKGGLQPGDHVLTTSVEHNAISRPLEQLQQQEIEYSRLPCDSTGCVDPAAISKMIRPNTKMLVMTHASNVLGTIQPVEKCFEIAKAKGLLTVLDTAQTAGFLPIDMEALQADVIAFTGHKSLLALAGIGGFVLNEEAVKRIQPWLTGGTGSFSELAEMPTVLPDRFEPGTPNDMGIRSLTASLGWLQEQTIAKVADHERGLTQRFIDGLQQLPVRLLGTGLANRSVPVVSVVPQNISCDELAFTLFADYGIVTRNGLHCAPWAHEVAGTLASGAVRFSFGWDTTTDEIDKTLLALNKLLKA